MIPEYLPYERIVSERDDDAVRRDLLNESAERLYDVLHVLEVVEVVGIDIENDPDARLQLKEAVHVLTGFSNEVLGAADLYVSVDLRQIASYQDRRLVISIPQNERSHRSNCRFAVSAADSYGILIVVHDHS